MEKIVKVIGISNNKIKVELERDKACSSCKTINLCQNTNKESFGIDKPNFLVKIGDKLYIKNSPYKMLLSSILLFLIPTIIFVAILLLKIKNNELIGLGIAFLTILIYYVILKVFISKHTNWFKSEITQIK